MRRYFALLPLLAGAPSLAAQAPYKIPPPDVVAILDAPPLPAVSVSPDRAWILLVEQRSMPTVAELARPWLRLAGSRINPRSNGPRQPSLATGLVLKRVADGTERRIGPPASGIGFPSWSPDGRRIAFTVTDDSTIGLWVAEAATGQARRLPLPPLNAVDGPPCQWMPDSARLLCLLVPEGRGAPPPEPAVPSGPTTQETAGRPGAVRTYEDLLQNAHDEALSDYYFIGQLALVDAAAGTVTKVGAPAVIDRADPAPGGGFILVVRTLRPYSYLVPAELFPKSIEIWTGQGERVSTLATLPLADNIPARGVRAGPRAIMWQPGVPATLVWVEALDDGNPKNRVAHQDRIVRLSAPFTDVPIAFAQLEKRYAGLVWDTTGVALLTEFDRDRRWTRTWLLDPRAPRPPGAAAAPLWDRSAEDRYGDPGIPLLRGTAGQRTLLRSGDWVYLAGAGASPQGERPFLDRLNLRTRRTERLWRADTVHYETVVALLDDAGRRVLTRRESRTEPPNYFVRDVNGTGLRALTAFRDPSPQLTGVQKRLVTYTREDGVPLSGTLYLPPGYTPGTRLPVVMWAYPIEFTSATAAGQVTAAPNRFNLIRGPSHLLFLTQGYAVFDDPKMPILGGDTANNHYVEQLVMSARAGVKALVDLGVADPDRIGVGGHSYGAFMTANLLAHSDLFRAGIARSGAYNRTLTPFGFQSEERTFWEVPGVYLTMSPFVHADSIDAPLLMIHGEADDNSGTFPIQSERLYAALKGLGKTARLVMLPGEAHGYMGRESVLDAVAEMFEWFDRWVKHAKPRGGAAVGNGSP
jgi:dipeptidyl aminopeptidase/acylaminoacyl peptidase